MSDADLGGGSGGRRLVSQAPGVRLISGIPALVAVGTGGRLELVGEELRLIKGGVFGHAVELLWLGYGIVEKSIPLRHISSVDIVKPLFLPGFIRFSYPGGPPETGHYLTDALAENTLIMSWYDNRAFYRIKAWIERWPQLPPLPAVADD